MQRTIASGSMAFLGVVFLWTLLGVAHPLWAQGSMATVSGTVQDDTGAVLPGVAVSIKNTDTGLTRTAVTNASGGYFEPNLSLGSYEVHADLAGFQGEARTGITLTIGRHAVVDFKLKVGEMSEDVVVVGEAPMVDTRSGSVGGLVDQHDIQQLPLNGRSYGELTRLIPGVVRGSGSTGFQGGYTDNLSMRGGRGETNKILLDGTDIQGIDNKLPGGVGGLTLGVDSVREFRVEVGTYSAEYGRALGGVINVSTKSGTNKFSGNVFEFLRNDALDSRNFFDEAKPDFSRHQFGFSLGGPIVRDKAFFFGNFEGLRERLGFTSIGTVPSVAAREGRLVAVNPAVQPYLALYPLPNGQDFGNGTAELIQEARQPTDQQFVSARGDYNLSNSDSVFVRYTFDKSKRSNPFDIASVTQDENSRNQFVTAEYQKIIRSTIFNTFRFGFSQNNKDLASGQSSTEISPSLTFVPGLSVVDSEILVEGISDFGVADAPRVWGTAKFQFTDNLVWRASNKHAVKLGLELIRFHQNIAQNSNNGGEYQFTSLVNFLRGTSRRFRSRLPGADQQRAVRTWYLGWYVQDDITIVPRLTLNLGLRHEVHTGPIEVDGKCSNVDDIMAPPRVGCPLFETFAKNFAPRLGFAWDVTGSGKTAVRGGAGIYYSEMSASSYYTSITNQPPFTEVADLRNPPFPNAYAVITSAVPQLRANPNAYTHVPSTYQFSLTLQRELTAKTMVSVGYAGALGRNWIRRGQENLAPFIILEDGRKFFPAGGVPRSPLYNEIRRVVTDADTSYHGLLVEVRRRFSANLSAQGSYTYSKAVDTAPFTTAGDVLDYYDKDFDVGLSDSDVRHNFSGAFTWQVPSITSSRAADVILGGWQLGAIVSLSSGHPFTPLVGFNVSRDLRGNTGAERPNLVPGANPNPVLGGPDRYFDPASFELQERGFYGNVPRNTIIGPGYATVDFSLTKNVGLGGDRNLQFRIEIFNLLNRANFGLPNARVYTSAGPDPTAGRITETDGTARQAQVGVKLYF